MLILRFLALFLTVFSLVPGGTYLFELPGRVALDDQSRFVLQAIHASWVYFAIPVVVALVVDAGLASFRRRRTVATAGTARAPAVLIVINPAASLVLTAAPAIRPELHGEEREGPDRQPESHPRTVPMQPGGRRGALRAAPGADFKGSGQSSDKTKGRKRQKRRPSVVMVRGSRW